MTSPGEGRGKVVPMSALCGTACALLTCAIALGCGSGGGDVAGRAPVLADSAGIRIVESASPEWAGGTAWAIDSVPALRIGALEGEDPYLFDGISGLTRLSDGRIALVEGATRQIRFFDAEGQHLASVGRAGEGPGEFARPPDFLVLPGDTILAFDYGAFRFTWFTLSGDVVRDMAFDSDAVPENFSGAFPSQRVILPDGDIFVYGSFAPNNTQMSERLPFMSYSPRPGLTTSDFRLGFATMDASDEIVVGRFTRYEGGYVEGTPVPGVSLTGAFRVSNEHYFASQWALGLDPVRVHVTTPGRREIRTFDRGGQLVRIVRQQRPLDRLDPSVIADIREIIEDSARAGAGVDVSAVMGLFDEIAFPDSVFPWSELEADRAGNVWALEHHLDSGDDLPVYDVFGPEGAWLGSVSVPPDLGAIAEIGADYVLTVWTDEFDVEYVHLHELRKDG